MSQLSILDAPQVKQRILTRAGKPVTGSLAKQAKAIVHPIKCYACPNGAPFHEELIYTPCDSGGVLSCRGHLPPS